VVRTAVWFALDSSQQQWFSASCRTQTTPLSKPGYKYIDVVAELWCGCSCVPTLSATRPWILCGWCAPVSRHVNCYRLFSFKDVMFSASLVGVRNIALPPAFNEADSRAESTRTCGKAHLHFIATYCMSCSLLPQPGIRGFLCSSRQSLSHTLPPTSGL
jgi:hypothetical protein